MEEQILNPCQERLLNNLRMNIANSPSIKSVLVYTPLNTVPLIISLVRAAMSKGQKVLIVTATESSVKMFLDIISPSYFTSLTVVSYEYVNKSHLRDINFIVFDEPIGYSNYAQTIRNMAHFDVFKIGFSNKHLASSSMKKEWGFFMDSCGCHSEPPRMGNPAPAQGYQGDEYGSDTGNHEPENQQSPASDIDADGVSNMREGSNNQENNTQWDAVNELLKGAKDKKGAILSDKWRHTNITLLQEAKFNPDDVERQARFYMEKGWSVGNLVSIMETQREKGYAK